MFHLKYYWILYIYCTSAGIFSLFLFIHRQCENAKQWAFSDFDEPFQEEYDFIVVGAGTAGSIVAGRLAQKSKYTVLLIEAGGESSFLQDIPLSAPLIQKSIYDWQYRTAPQDASCQGMVNNISCWPMGKLMGGTSRLNYMIYLRGHEKDYETWSHGQDWTFADVLHYFKKSETQMGIFSDDRGFHGRRGPVIVDDLRYTTKLAGALLNASNELGYPTVDLNTMKSSPGVMQIQVTGSDGARWSSESALKKLTLDSSSIRIMTNTLVEKVLLREKFEAYGVRVVRQKRRMDLRAKHAVILSAGAVGTPKILLLSGIGPKEHLKEHDIEPQVDLPVGENLQDHVTTGPDLVLLNHSLPISERAVLKTPLLALNYLLNGQGLMTHPGCEFIGLFHTDGGSLPDIQLMALPAGLSTDAGAVLRKAMCISDKVWDGYYSPLVGRQAITILPTLLHPTSYGYVRLRSSDPEDLPLINPNYLQSKEDIAALIRGLKLIKRLVNTKSMQSFGAEINKRKMPGCEHLKFSSDPYWECYLRHLTVTAYHPVGSCRMGRGLDSVVGHDLRVHRTNRLYVVDASIMPTMPSSNINAAVLMIAEKGADLIQRQTETSRHTCSSVEVFLKTESTPAYPRSSRRSLG